MASTWQTRNAQAKLATLAPLTPSNFTLTPVKTAYTSLESSTMGSLGTSADGFAASIAPVFAAVDVDNKGLKDYDGYLLGAGFTPGAAAKSIIDPLDKQVNDFLSSAGNQLGVTTPGGGSPPGSGFPVQPKPVPPITGGGTGGGSGTGSSNPGGGGGGGYHDPGVSGCTHPLVFEGNICPALPAVIDAGDFPVVDSKGLAAASPVKSTKTIATTQGSTKSQIKE